jgi:exopolyphosphatase / guanosine-5'-triphosphate,3'-diphosphate pyrophosphatase
MHDSNDPEARIAAYASMCARVRDSFCGFAPRLPVRNGHAPRLLGTSGTVTTLGSVYLDLPTYDRRQVDGLRAPVQAMRDICGQLAALPIPERALYSCIGAERADLVVAGCAILEAIFDLWPAEEVGIADRGIREGILRQLIASGERP